MICEFGDSQLDLDRFELQRDTRKIRLQPLVFDLLVHLVLNRERVVTKAELRDAVWRGAHVSQTAVARAVMKVRRAIGDDGEAQELIATVHSRGYRFVGPVRLREREPEPVVADGRSIAA